MSNIPCESCRKFADDVHGQWYVCEKAPRELRLAAPNGQTLLQTRLSDPAESLPLLVGALSRGLMLRNDEVRVLAAVLLAKAITPSATAAQLAQSLVQDIQLTRYLARDYSVYSVLRALFETEAP